ncbi:MAG: RHS repeat-associated core domain-containing protein, partial [Hellea sp.]
IAYLYNGLGHMYRKTLPSGRNISYFNDGLGRHNKVSWGSATYADTVNYHPSGQIQTLTYGNGQVFTQALDSRRMPERLTVSKSGTDIQDLYYDYDLNGRVYQQLNFVDPTHSRVHSYDALGRLKTANSAVWGLVDYGYDALGNLRSKSFSNWNSSGPRTVTNSYNSKNQVSSSNDNGTVRTIAYDTRGNVTTLGNLAFVYDASDQPTVVTGGANGNYVYDGNMKRVKSLIDGKTIYNVYDNTGRLVHVDEVTDGKETDYLHGMGQTLARIENNVFTYLHPDHLGSPQAGTKGQGNPVAQYGDVAWNQHYTPFGEALISNAANDNQGGFTGHIKDKATGLNYMQARYYDPKIGRFLSPDPGTFLEKSYPGQFNRYAYTWNDPINANDPDGEFVNFVAKFVIDVGLEEAIQAASGQEINLGSAVKGAAIGVLDPTKTARKVAKLGKLANTARKAKIQSKNKTTSKVGTTCCFVAGTLVETELGLRPIEKIKVGDLVLSKDEETGTTEYKPVLDLLPAHNRVIWVLKTVSELGHSHTFQTTDDHPWWIEGHGWKRTDELSAKDILSTNTGLKVSVLSIKNTKTLQPTFNIEVADFNTYFVGENKVWVHNACGPVKISNQKQNAHVAGTNEHQRRVANGKPTSTFDDRKTADALTNDTVATGTKNVDSAGTVTYRKDYSPDRVGTGPKGGSQSQVKVHQDSKGVCHGHPCGPEN